MCGSVAADASGVARGLWIAATVLGLAYSTASILVSLWRRQATVDVIAWLAPVGALLVDEPLAGAVIAVMLTTARCWRPALAGAGGGRARLASGRPDRRPTHRHRDRVRTTPSRPRDLPQTHGRRRPPHRPGRDRLARHPRRHRPRPSPNALSNNSVVGLLIVTVTLIFRSPAAPTDPPWPLSAR